MTGTSLERLTGLKLDFKPVTGLPTLLLTILFSGLCTSILMISRVLATVK